MIDKIRFEQLLLNLVINSNQAIINGGTIIIKTELSQIVKTLNEGDETTSHYNVMISVEDTGIGMDTETLNQMYEPFYTTKKEGTGLGLTIVYNIVKQHRGEISINSNINVGTSSKITFPGVQKSRKKAVIVSQRKQFKSIEDRNHILLIEDNESIRKMICEILKEEGFVIETATNPQKAKELLEKLENKPNLIISDIRMPGMNGVDFVKSIKDDFLDTKILFMTGFYDVNIPDILGDLPFEIIHKPFQIEEIVIKVKQMLNQ